jgi:hypothetical protein
LLLNNGRGLLSTALQKRDGEESQKAAGSALQQDSISFSAVK